MKLYRPAITSAAVTAVAAATFASLTACASACSPSQVNEAVPSSSCCRWRTSASRTVNCSTGAPVATDGKAIRRAVHGEVRDRGERGADGLLGRSPGGVVALGLAVLDELRTAAAVREVQLGVVDALLLQLQALRGVAEVAVELIAS